MKRTTCWLAIALLPALAMGDTKKPSPAKKQFNELVEQYEKLGGAQQLADKFFDLAKENARRPVALDALGWILVNVRRGEHPKQASQVILRDHLQAAPLGMLCLELADSTALEAETVLRAARKSSRHSTVQAAASFSLAAYLQNQLKVQQALLTQPSLRRRLEQFYGRPFTRHVRSLDKDKTVAEIESLYDRVVTKYSSVDAEMTEAAQTQLIEVRYLAVGRTAREIEGQDVDNVAFKLSDYRGKVVVLSFWGHW